MKKMMALGLATALTATTLAGCGGGQEADATTAAPATTAAATEASKAEEAAEPTEAAKEAEGEPIELVWWAFPTFGVDTGYEQELADAFHAAKPTITVKVEYIDFTSGPD